MTESTLTIELTKPSQIDADPTEVGQLAVSEVAAGLSALHGLLPEVVVQARSSHGSLLLERAPSASPEALAEAWEDADAHSRIIRASGLIARAAQMLREAAEDLTS